MPTIRFASDTPTIRQIWIYTFRVPQLRKRFRNMNRDILPSKLKVTERLVYSKDRKDQPDRKFVVESWSAPQYYPYNKLKSGKRTKRQLQVKHKYDLTLVIENDKNGNFSFDSRIRWRVGGFKKWNTKPSQNLIKSVYKKTRDNLSKRYGKGTQRYKDEINKIKAKGKYENVGDYNAQVNGLNGEYFYTLSPLAYVYNCSYGVIWNKEFNSKKPFNEIKFPFFCKHSLALIFYLLKKRILKK